MVINERKHFEAIQKDLNQLQGNSQQLREQKHRRHANKS